MSKSAVIIGGGLGGLFTGALLANEGLEVTVLEKNHIIGGGLQSFRRFGEVFDTGMHIIGGMQKDGNIRRICEFLGIWRKVHVRDVDPENTDNVYFSEDGRTYHIAQGRNKFIRRLSEEFPDQRKNLEDYIDAMYRIASEVDHFYLRPSTNDFQVYSDDFHMSANGFIAKYVSDGHLRSVLAYMNPLYGGRGDMTPAYIHALISVLYIDGGSRFAGGSILFAETLKEFIEQKGGKVIADEAVTAIHSLEKTITGVKGSSGREYTADYYISAIHPCSLFPLTDDSHLLPKPYVNRLNSLPNAYSAFTLNIKLKPGTFKFCNYTIYYMSRYDAIWKFGDTDNWPCGFLYITPPEIEQGEYAGKIIVTAPMQWRFVEKWADTTVGKRGKAYEEWKKECSEKLLDCMEEVYPDFRNCIESVNSASPLTIRDFYGVKEGSMCGFSKDCNNLVLSQVPVLTKLSNLYLTGQNCSLHGFCGVILTAMTTCEAILGRNHIADKINRFEGIRPFYAYEIPAAMKRIAAGLKTGDGFEPYRDAILRTDSVSEFQQEVMMPYIEKHILPQFCSWTCEGLEKIRKDEACLFVADKSATILDAAIFAYSLAKHGLDTPEIACEDGQIPEGIYKDIARSNKVFTINSQLSDYVHNSILNKGTSVWLPRPDFKDTQGIKTVQVKIEHETADGRETLRISI